ncbi:DUF2130 domain-containing protein [Campylobacter sp. CCUG 57310]|uniref:DUF2130 domain-containing protein n=1 Tax=Campylobacter sp. CCUG 57310 TaxID=2517362 RepID=UPI0015670FF2|nr:DUF2130 domain-containing protein [Campylobacter sp. CCUG 57310]QKF92574.1 DUF2130 domain-containing protein [Campylobacter sp. CCUG 57310]
MKDSVKCPNCGFDVDVNSAFKSQVEQEFNQKLAAEKKNFEKEVEAKREQYKTHLEQLNAKQKELEAKQAEFDARVAEALKLRQSELEAQIKIKFENENLAAVNALKAELEAKSKQVSELNLKTVEIEKLKREKDELEASIKAKSELEFSAKLQAEKERLQKEISSANELKFRQKDEQMEALKKQLSEAQRRIEQGSQQLQGEVQELAIEEWLRAKFPLDTIEEVKKGANGADCMQIVNTREVQNCGKIYYESKRTKNFSNEWIEKFRSDMRSSGADVGVLVSEARPKDMERLGLVDGVWVCSYEEFKALSFVLRNSVIELNFAKSSVQNKTGKIELLYSYLTSNEFKMRIEAIVEGFTSMQEDLIKEQNAMKRIWKSREKQIEKVRDNAIEMFGSIKGIAGNSIGEIKTLELGFDESVAQSELENE